MCFCHDVQASLSSVSCRSPASLSSVSCRPPAYGYKQRTTSFYFLCFMQRTRRTYIGAYTLYFMNRVALNYTYTVYTVHIRCMYGVYGARNTVYTVHVRCMYGVYGARIYGIYGARTVYTVYTVHIRCMYGVCAVNCLPYVHRIYGARIYGARTVCTVYTVYVR